MKYEFVDTNKDWNLRCSIWFWIFQFFKNLVLADLLVIPIRTIQVNLKLRPYKCYCPQNCLQIWVQINAFYIQNAFLCGFYPQSLKGKFMNLLCYAMNSSLKLQSWVCSAQCLHNLHSDRLPQDKLFWLRQG